MFTPTGNRAYDTAARAADAVRDAVLRTPGVTQAQARQADITFHQTIVAIAPGFGMTPLASRAALVELGVSPIPQT